MPFGFLSESAFSFTGIPNVGRQTVYAMLEAGILPGIRLGQRWLVTRHAYLEWERTCGTGDRSVPASGLHVNTEVRS